jgi:NTE family protein
MYKPSILILASILFIATATSAQEQVIHKRPKIGLVLSGGGAKGFAHIGVLKVLEEAGIHIDYIGGTSMGSIIGGLYSIGYSADSLEKIIKSLDWPELLTDRFPRNYLSFEEKKNDGKYILPFPLYEGKFQLPIGLIPGQNLELLISKLTWNANEITDFNKLPIPFLCVATDIAKGEAVVMRSGSLQKSIRASMAIPTIFTPILMNEKTLVDGGIFNNFPVDEVRKMGADIIIGVDVGFEQFNGADLNSMLRIVEQSVFIHTVDDNKKSRAKCDIFIMPDLKAYTLMDFDQADSLMYLGKIAAMKQFGKLKALADSINQLGIIDTIKKITPIKYFEISDIKVVGNKNTPRSYILSKLNIEVPSKVTATELDEAMNRVHGTLLFKKVTYSIAKTEPGHILTVEVEERAKSLFSLGVNYNTDYKASIYLNSSWVNLFTQGSKLSLDALLGANPRLDVTYFIFSGWNPNGIKPTNKNWRFDFGLNFSVSNYDLVNYNNGLKISSFGYTDIAGNIYAQTIFKNSYAWGIGIQNEYNYFKADFNPFNVPTSYHKFFNIYSYLKFDTYNNTYFPEKGVQLNYQIRYISKLYDNTVPPGILINGKWSNAIPVQSKFTIISSLYTGISIADSIPDTYQYRIGGLTTYYVKNGVPFVGEKLLEHRSRNYAIVRLDFQYEIFRKNFIILNANAGKSASLFENLISGGDKLTGLGISYGYYSLLGPIELTFMKSPNENLMVYLNVGFWF